MSSVLQPWVQELPMMQQTVLLTAVRGPDGLPKYHASKYLLRWYRRCFLISSMEGEPLLTPYDLRGGSFTGPSVKKTYLSDNLGNVFEATGALRDGEEHSPNEGRVRGRGTWQEAMSDWVSAYIRGLDEVPHHFQLHFMHGAEILGYKHPFSETREWWYRTYLRLVYDMHLRPESHDDMDDRLSDSTERWLAHSDSVTTA